MLKKIISGGQTASDLATLDVAIKLGIEHGGWITRGRTTEAGPLPEKYNLQEMPTYNYSECIEQNVIDSQGTLIIYYDKLSGDLLEAERATLKHKRQLLGVDLNQIFAFKAASLVHDWIQLRHIDVLYVIGPSATVNPGIGKHTMLIVEGALILNIMNAPLGRAITDYSKKDYLEKLPIPPKSVKEAVDRLISEMALKDKVIIANMTYDELVGLNLNLGAYIRNAFSLWSGNDELMESCKFTSKDKKLDPDSASFAIIDELWEKLRKTHKLKVIK